MPFDGNNVKSLCIPKAAKAEELWRNALIKNDVHYTGWQLFPSPDAAMAALKAHDWHLPLWVNTREGRVLWESWGEVTQVRVD